MTNRERAETRKWAIGIILFSGLPIYIAGYFFLNLLTAFWIHLGVTALYLGLLLLFGSGSVIEMGVIVAIISILVLVLAPVFKRAEMNRMRHQSTINRNANHR